MKERIQLLMRHFGHTAARLADVLGVQRSGISHILSGRNQPSYDFLLKLIHAFPEIDVEWLITGKGAMLKTDVGESASGNISKNEKSAAVIRPLQFNKSVEEEEITVEKDNKIVKVTNVTDIQRIVIFYTDGTFSNFTEAGRE